MSSKAEENVLRAEACNTSKEHPSTPRGTQEETKTVIRRGRPTKSQEVYKLDLKQRKLFSSEKEKEYQEENRKNKHSIILTSPSPPADKNKKACTSKLLFESPTSELEDSPALTQRNLNMDRLEDKLENILREIMKMRETQERQWKETNEWMKTIENRQAEQEKQQASFKSRIVECEKSTDNMKAEIAELKRKISKLENSATDTQREENNSGPQTQRTISASPHTNLRWKEWERIRKKKNIIVSGWDFERGADKEHLESWLQENLNVTVGITKTWIIRGKKKPLGAECKDKENQGKHHE